MDSFLQVTQNPPPTPPSSFYFALHLAIAARKENEFPNLPDFAVALDSSNSSDLM